MEIDKKITDKLILLDKLPTSYGFHQNVGSNSTINRKQLGDKIVALKKIERDYEFSLARQTQIFLREVIDQILAEHPAVLPICGFNIFHYSPNKECFVYRPCLATIFCDRGMLNAALIDISVNQKLSKRHIQTQQYIFAYGIARGMKNLYENKILHRDLKNENIFVMTPKWESENIPDEVQPLINSKDKYYIPLIADLGLAKIAQDTQQSQQCGTFYYLAPEVIASTKYSFPVDVYSYAIILSNIFQLKDKPIFKCVKTTLNLTQYVTRGGRPEIGDCTECQKQFLAKLWDTNPKNRLTFIDIVDYLDNPQEEDFIFDNYDPIMINAYKKYIDLQIQLRNQNDDTPDSKNDAINDIMSQYQKYKMTEEKYYQLDKKDICALKKIIKEKEITNNMVSTTYETNDYDSNGEFNESQKNIEIMSDYVLEFINNGFSSQKYEEQIKMSDFYLSEGETYEKLKSYKRAKEYYIKAIQLGNIHAATKLGVLLLKSNKQEIRRRGIELLEYSSINKDTEGLFYYGYFISEGNEKDHIKSSKELGAQLLVESSQQGHPLGYHHAATIYHKLGLESNAKGETKKTRKFLTLAMENYKASYEAYKDEESKRLSEELEKCLQDN